MPRPRLGGLCPGLLAALRPTLPVHAFSLRFQSGAAEAGFLQARKAFLVQRSRAVAFVGALTATAALCFALAVGRMHLRASASSDAEHEANLVTLISGAANLPILLFFIASLRSDRLARIASPVAVETAGVLVLSLVMLATVLSTPANVISLRGLDVRGLMAYSSDTTVLLTIDGIVTASHLALPARWIVMLPLQVVSVLLYLSIILIGGAEPAPWSNFIYLSALVGVSSVGKRHAELSERQAFLALIEEKSLRCTAELKLSQASLADEPRPAGDHGSHDSSSAVTDRSGSVFNLALGDQGVSDKLGRMSKIARAERWSLDASAVRLLGDQVLGRGGFGIVVRALMSGIVVAVKVPNKRLEDASALELEDLCQELRVFRHLRHPNVVAFHGALIDPPAQRIALVLECVRGTLLHDLVRHGRREGEPACKLPSTLERFQILVGICSALLHMHTRAPSIVHSDLKSTNVMVETLGGEARPKLLDFGFARLATRGAKLAGGTWAWMAPELMRGDKGVSCSVDVYSFGHLINFTATGMLPPRPSKLQRRVGCPALPLPRPPGHLLEPACGPLADACLRFKEDLRPNIAEVHKHLALVPEQMALPGAPPWVLEDLRLMAGEARMDPAGAGGAAFGGWPVEQSSSGAGGPGRAPATPTHGSSGPGVDDAVAQPPGLAPLPESAVLPMPTEEHQQPSSSGKCRPCPGLPATSMTTVFATILEMASHWNIQSTRQCCCTVHAAAELLMEAHSLFVSRPCADLPYPSRCCTACSLIQDGPECDFCFGPTVARDGTDEGKVAL